MNKTQAILALLAEGVAYAEIARRVGVETHYVRAVRSRYKASDAVTFWRRTRTAHSGPPRQDGYAPAMALPQPPRVPRKGYRPRPTGQPRDELRVLAETLYRWRTEGRHA
jgi:hypothetical protein